MTNFDRTAERSTDPRPVYIPLGTDGEGAHHVYHTRRERVIVVSDTGREYVQALGEQDVHDWMDYVDGRRGWADRRMYRDATAAMIEQVAQGVGA